MDVQERYRRWKDYPLEDQDLTAELERKRAFMSGSIRT